MGACVGGGKGRGREEDEREIGGEGGKLIEDPWPEDGQLPKKVIRPSARSHAALLSESGRSDSLSKPVPTQTQRRQPQPRRPYDNAIRSVRNASVRIRIRIL